MKTEVMTEKQVRKMEVAELKKVKSALGVTRKNKLFGGTEFQNRFKKRRKHLLNLGSLEKDCF